MVKQYDTVAGDLELLINGDEAAQSATLSAKISNATGLKCSDAIRVSEAINGGPWTNAQAVSLQWCGRVHWEAGAESHARCSPEGRASLIYRLTP